MNSTKQSSLFVRLLLDRADLIPRAANGVHNSLRVQLCFREDHGLVFAPGRTHLFDRAGFAHGVIDGPPQIAEQLLRQALPLKIPLFSSLVLRR